MSKFGQYELLDRIAVGGMAEIFRGRAFGEEGFEKMVAIKRVLPSYARDSRFVAMLVTEARIHAGLSHRNIVQIQDLGISPDGEYFIVLEYVDGPDLAALLARLHERKAAARLPDPVALYVAIELGEGVHFAHQLAGPDAQPLGLVHRDISPSNVLLSYAGEVKLSDFGLAKRRTDHSVVGSLKGKLAYMSPEQARRSLLDRRSDIFALGAVLFELLTGHQLRQITDDVSGWQQVASGLVPPPRRFRPDLSPALDALLNRALAPDPRDRFPNARAFVDQARAALAVLPRSRVGEAGELQAILKAILPPGSPRPSKEHSRVIRLVSEIVPGGREQPDVTVPVFFAGAAITAGTEDVTAVTPPPQSSSQGPPALPPPRLTGQESAPHRPIPAVLRPPPRAEERRSAAGLIAVDSNQLNERADRPAADEQRIIAAWPSLGLTRTPAAVPMEDDPGPTPPPPLIQAPPAPSRPTPVRRPAPVQSPPAPSGFRPPTPAQGAPPLQPFRPQASVNAPHPAAPALAPALPPALPQALPPAYLAPAAPPGRTASFAPVAAPRAMDVPPSAPQPAPSRLGLSVLLLLLATAGAVVYTHQQVVPLQVLMVWFQPARLDIRTQPSGAQVFLDGRRLSAQTPTYTEIRRNRADHVLELRRDGFRTEQIPLRYDRTVELLIDVKLAPAPPPGRQPEPAVPSASGPPILGPGRGSRGAR